MAVIQITPELEILDTTPTGYIPSSDTVTLTPEEAITLTQTRLGIVANGSTEEKRLANASGSPLQTSIKLLLARIAAARDAAGEE